MSVNRGLLVGINAYPRQPLRGCVNDVIDMADFLVEKCEFEESDIRLLTDARATTDAIRQHLGWLLNRVRAGDRLLFHYSGHGAQMPTRNPQGEVDKMDEVICPVDFDWNEEHAIRDKEFNALFRTVPAEVEFVWVSDSCHSGDLEKEILKGSIKTLIPPADIDWRIRTARKNGIRALGFDHSVPDLHVALIAGCRSDQTSADAVFDNRPNGALTYFLLGALKQADGLKESLDQLVENVSKELEAARYKQEPQLEGDPAIIRKAFLA
jgi:hypothetical protein